ncbi:MAG: hypothetical protein K6F68_07375 [Clostridiales bacterium]|nr:hypothetical protein [Clostridiales bacterium]
MKKTIGLLLVLAMTFALAGAALASGSVPTFVISEETAAPGEEVRVTVSIKNNTAVASIQIEPQFDHTFLEWIGVEQGDYTGTWDPRIDRGFLRWFGPSGHNVSFDGVFATLIFKVSESAPSGDLTVTVTYDEDNVFNQDDDNVYFAVRPGKVTVSGGGTPSETPTPSPSEQTPENSPTPTPGQPTSSPENSPTPAPGQPTPAQTQRPETSPTPAATAEATVPSGSVGPGPTQTPEGSDDPLKTPEASETPEGRPTDSADEPTAEPDKTEEPHTQQETKGLTWLWILLGAAAALGAGAAIVAAAGKAKKK